MPDAPIVSGSGSGRSGILGLFSGGRKSRRHSRKSRRGPVVTTDGRRRAHKGGKSRRASRKSRHASRK